MNRRTKLTALVLAALLCTAMLAGCGGNNNSTTPSDTPVSQASTDSGNTNSTDHNSGTETPSHTDEPSEAPAPSSDESTTGEESTPSSSGGLDEITNKNYREMDADYTVENGVVVVNQDGHYRAMELFGGGSGDAYVDSLNALRSQLDSSINIYSMIAPLSCEFYLPANYADYSAEQKEYFDDVAQRLDGGIRSIDLIDVLGKHTGEAIYCRTDHHWMPLGAYYAAQAFANAAGVDFKDLSTFTPQTINGFVGTMYAFTDGDINIKNDPEDFTYHISGNYNECHTDFYDTSFNFDYTGSYFKEVGDPQSNAYLTFFGGDEQIVKIRTNVSNGKKLLIVKDSYGNAEPGYLMNSFEEIYIVDMRYFNLNLIRFVKDLGITDVLFTMCTFSAFGQNSYKLPDLLTQSPDEPIIDTYNR